MTLPLPPPPNAPLQLFVCDNNHTQELGNVATSGENNTIRVSRTNRPQLTAELDNSDDTSISCTKTPQLAPMSENSDVRVSCAKKRRLTPTIMTPAARKAVQGLPVGKPDSQSARARYLKAKAGERKAFHAVTSATQSFQETLEWKNSLLNDAGEAKLYSNRKFQLLRELQAVAAENAKTAREATKKVFDLQRQVQDLKAKEALSETCLNDHGYTLLQLEAQYEENERILRGLQFNLRVSSEILENTHKKAADLIREQAAFDLPALRLLQQKLDDLTASIELLSPDARAYLSPGDAERAVAAGRAKAEALCRLLEEGVQNIANELFVESNGTTVLGQTTMPDLATRIAEESRYVVLGFTELEAWRLMQEVEASEIKNGYSTAARLRAEHADTVSDLAKSQASLAALTKEAAAAKARYSGSACISCMWTLTTCVPDKVRQ